MSSIYKMQPKYMIINFNNDMIASLVTKLSSSMEVNGNFRTPNDFCAMIWETEDKYSHKAYKYPTICDFTGIVLSYQYHITGSTLMDEVASPALTIETNTGELYYVRLWNYVKNRPLDYFETLDATFPANRVPGGANGEIGIIEIDFDELYAGWSPVDVSWNKVPVTDIKDIKWGFTPDKMNMSNSQKFHISFEDWTVRPKKAGESDKIVLREVPDAKSAHDIMMCDDYDDSYHLTPERIVEEYYGLGYRGFVDFYIGASHYYDKSMQGAGYIMDTSYPFNAAYEAWYRDYAQRLSIKGYTLIHSLAMELLEPPWDWYQRDWEGNPGVSGWVPPPHFVSFTNPDVKKFYFMNAKKHAQISVDYGMEPYVQLGEPWWWVQPETNAPCFYDQATKDAYSREHDGADMPIIQKERAPIGGNSELCKWLGEKIGQFTLEMRDAVKSAYSNAKFGVLFFPPTVLDPDRVSEISKLANCPLEQWKYPNLDYFMIEDYDYLIHHEMNKNLNTLYFTQEELDYPLDKIHYFSGFVLANKDNHVWGAINNAINNARTINIGNIYIWAGTQVRRDGWYPPANKAMNIAREKLLVDKQQLTDVMAITKHFQREKVTDAMIGELNYTLKRYGITNMKNIQLFLGVCMHESRTALTEAGDVSEEAAKEYCKQYDKRLGNSKDGDGYLFRGAGYIQLTGYSNYEAFSNHIEDSNSGARDPYILAESLERESMDKNSKYPNYPYYIATGYGADCVAVNYPWIAAGYFWEANNLNKRIEDERVSGLSEIGIFKKVSNAVYRGDFYSSSDPHDWDERQERFTEVVSTYN